MENDTQKINKSNNKRYYKDKDYFKKYYQNNKEKWAYKESDRIYMRNYMKNYDKDKKSKIYNDFMAEYDGKFIYFILDENKEIKYIGKTTNIYRRIGNHKNLKKKYSYETDTILYLNFTDKLTDEELSDMEKYFIELFNLDLNNQCGDYDTSIADKLPKRLIFNEFKFKKNEDER